MAASGNDILKSAIECFQTGRLEEAERLFKSLLARQPNNVAALNILGVLLASLHRYAEAEPHLRSALKFTANSDATLYNYGIVLKGLGKSAEALEYFSKALAINPAVPDTWNNRGTVYNDLNRYEQAVQDFDKAIALHPNHPDASHNKGNSLQQLKRYGDALAAYDRALMLKPDRVEGWMGRGNALNGLRHYGDALAAYDRALSLKTDLVEASLGRGHAMLGLGRIEDAGSAYEKALALAPDPVTVWLRYGGSLSEFNRPDDALAAFDRALVLKPDLADAWLGRGNVCFLLKRREDALAAYDKAISHAPHLAEAWLGRGNVLTELRQEDGAVSAYGRALELAPDLVAAGLGRGHVLSNQRRYGDALAVYDNLIAFKPEFAEAWLGRGNLLADLRRYDEAFASYDQALRLAPDLAGAWLGRGNALSALKRHGEAFAAYDRAFALQPDLKFIQGYQLYTKQLICDWNNLPAEWDRLLSAVRGDLPASDPFAILMGPSTAADQLKCAQIYTADICPPNAMPLWQGERYTHDRIRLAYLSADFRDHALPHLLARMFELHDRERFETIAIALGPDDESAMRARLNRSFERFVPINNQGDKDIAGLIRELEVDILVDLTGFTSTSRSELLAFRPAPIQVNYLYPGMTSHVDYVFGDKFVIPEDHRRLFSPPVVYLPHTCFTFDSEQSISGRTPTRAENGLPDTGFVFCAFNNSYKLGAEFFDIWMRLLKGVPDSVLWLSSADPAAVGNLRREAQARDIDPARLCFAPFVKDMADHLARYRLADLFLDTLPFNAHTTALDSLWAGLPVLTCLGSTFVGRVAAALLNALELPELVTRSPAEYEALALKLASDAAMLAEIRRKLADRRLTAPLFDAGLFTAHIESAYVTMHDRHCRGLPPEHFVIPH